MPLSIHIICIYVYEYAPSSHPALLMHPSRVVWQRLEEGVSGLNDEVASEASAARSLEQRVTVTEDILQDSDRLRYPDCRHPHQSQAYAQSRPIAFGARLPSMYMVVH
jgi:hypothetical protein